MNWTPGKWRVCPELDAGDGRHVHAGEHDLSICRCATPHIYHNGGVDKVTPAQREANAFLIAAAKDLYVALRELLSEVELLIEVNDKEYAHDYVNDKTIQSANLALAKARGG